MTGALRAFDLRAPLPNGTTLIEASAGTGKTWTLAVLVTRYVADEGRPLDELLVVTFSRLASQELRERVRAQLEATVERLEATPGADDDELVQHLRRGTNAEVAQRIRRIRAALADFDTATIATIHQFCHLVLRSLGVAGDSDPHATLVEDLTELRRDIVDDLFLARAVRAGTWADHATSSADARLALDNTRAPLLPDEASPTVAARQDFMRDVRVEFARRKRRAALLGYDDLLAELADALEDEDGPARTRMRQRWSVVLVDEFQDTDPVQWEVFSRAFATPGKTLVLIGDPKQAIYGFRGGDVHTYLAAARTATTACSLPTNHRSDAPLVDALQVLTCGAELSPGIEVHPIRAALTRHRLAGAPDDSPVRLRVVGGDRLPMDQARTLVAADTATEIAALLDAGAEYDRAALRDRIVEQRVRWPVDLDVDELAVALELVCATPLGTSADDVTLSDIAPRDRLAEMDFELPLGGGDRAGTGSLLGGIAALLRRHLPAGDSLLPYAAALDSTALGEQVLRGYLTGSVDLTFRHGGRYFVVDHKTNRLGEPEAELTLDDYAPDRLAAAMTHTSYPLQAILYAVVLHRYLRWRLPGYDPVVHLGGVLYLYLRGMAGPDTPRVDGSPHGVFAWRPPVALIEDVSALLDGANAPANAAETVDDH